MGLAQVGISKPIICDPGCCPLQCISKSLFTCSVDFLVRTASTRSNAKTVSQAEHFHAIGLLVWSLKTVAVRTGIAIVSHGPIQDASLAETTPPRALIQKAHLTVAKHPDCTHTPGGKTVALRRPLRNSIQRIRCPSENGNNYFTDFNAHPAVSTA